MKFIKNIKKRIENAVIERRKRQKYLKATSKLASYVEDLHNQSDDEGALEILNTTWQKEHHFLQIPHSESRFISLLVKALKSPKVLELGTFRGWSAVFIARFLDDGASLITIDHDERIKEDAIGLWQVLGLGEKIEFRKEKALDALRNLRAEGEVFDLIFVDAEKSEYMEYVDLAFEILNDKGIMLVDNVLWAGLVANSNPSNNGAKYMKEFNDYVFKRFGTSACLIPAWDGVVMIVK